MADGCRKEQSPRFKETHAPHAVWFSRSTWSTHILSAHIDIDRQGAHFHFLTDFSIHFVTHLLICSCTHSCTPSCTPSPRSLVLLFISFYVISLHSILFLVPSFCHIATNNSNSTFTCYCMPFYESMPFYSYMLAIAMWVTVWKLGTPKWPININKLWW